MYDAVADPYCYAGTTVLKNIPGIRDQAALEDFEAIATAQRAEEPLPNGRLSIAHYKATHHHLFQDVYRWAGNFRTVRISKDGNMFCYPENIAREMRTLFTDLKAKRFLQDLSRDRFVAEGASFLSTLNAIHPFREGNGRTQTTFFALVAHQASHPLDLDRLDADQFLRAMIESFQGNEAPLVRELDRLTK